MTLKKAPNVREIRGRFENWNNDCNRLQDVIIPLGKPPPLYGDNHSRDRSFSVFSKCGGDFAPNLVRNNSLHQGKSSRRSHFAEKQKLAESIVANIKCSNNDLRQGNSYRTVLNSLFDKELKSLTKVQRMAKNNEERQFKENILDNGYGKNQKRVVENVSCNNEIRYNNCKDLEANNDFGLNSIDSRHIKADYDIGTNKYKNNLNLDRSSNNQKLVVKHQLNSFSISPSPLKCVYDSIQEPLRPPRRRAARKKSMAPSPPPETGPNGISGRHVSFDGPDQFSTSSYHNLSTLDSDSIANLESMNVRRNSAGDLHPFIQSKETFPNYRRDPFSDFPSHNTCPEDLYSLPRHVIYAHDNGQDMPCGPPPRKPPRTFAHDIYRQGKQTNLSKSKKDLDAMYAKPLKKTKKVVQKVSNVDKTVSFIDSIPQSKPPIAPKPQIANNYKRYSVIEPIESPDRSGEDVTPIKRNTSFRFSFRNPRSSSPMASKPIARLKDAVRNFQFKKDADGRIAKLSKSAEHLSSKKSLQQEDHIYATPQYNSTTPIGKPEELHYMCSPLFPMENSEDGDVPEEDTVGPQKAKLDWGGLKKEFRQSCRMVQKRIKGVVR